MKSRLLILIAAILLIGPRFAFAGSGGGKASGRGFDIVGDIPQATVTNAKATINANTYNLNCLTDLTVSATAAFEVRVLDQGTTIYHVNLPAAGALFENRVMDDAICNSVVGSSFTITVSSVTIYDINYKGFIRQ